MKNVNGFALGGNFNIPRMECGNGTMSVRRPSLRILIIEDDPDTAMLMADSLVDRFGANCCAIARTLIETKETDLGHFDIVLCDFHLPDGNGLTALRNVLSRRPEIPVIMVTSEREVSVVMDAIRTGAYDYVVKSDQMFDLIPLTIEKNLEVFRIKRENKQLQDDLEKSFRQIQESNAQLAEMVRKLEEMAHTDALTGLCNRRHMNNMLIQMFAESKRYGSPLTAVMIDLDGFKQVNDVYGHQAGDEALVRIGQIISRNAREADVASRYGGDEFVLLMPQTDGETAAAFVNRIRRQFEDESADAAYAEEGQSPITLSVGIACTALSDVRDSEHLISLADRALYAAKRGGKDRTVLCIGGENEFEQLGQSSDWPANRRASA